MQTKNVRARQAFGRAARVRDRIFPLKGRGRKVQESWKINTALPIRIINCRLHFDTNVSN